MTFEISHKLNTQGNKAIIAKFIIHKVKTNLYRARTNLKQVKLANVFPDSSYATRVQSSRIFINENLTFYRRRIMSKANEKREDGELLSAWSMDRNIYVKTSPRPSRICSLLRSIWDGLCLFGTATYLFFLPAKRFSCSL